MMPRLAFTRSEMFLEPLYASNLRGSALTPERREQLANFQRDGYLVIDLLGDRSAEWFETLQQEIDELLDGGARVQDAWRIIPKIREIAIIPELLTLLAELYGRPAFPFQTLNFRAGSQQKPHSDHIHFSTFPPHFMCGVWVALEDITKEAGPLTYYPGSHNLPLLDLSSVGVIASNDRDHSQFHEMYPQMIDHVINKYDLRPQYLEVARGKALIWAANLIHGGAEIADVRTTRFSQVTHYYFDECVYYTPMDSDPLLGRLAIRNPTNILHEGKRVRSEYFGRPLSVGVGQKFREWYLDTFHKRRIHIPAP